jgi:predicted small lipoprotein YifL
VNRITARLLPTIALFGALALSLTACGLKGPLDPPPGATPEQTQLDGQRTTPPPEGETQPRSPRKRIFLDWLLD